MTRAAVLVFCQKCHRAELPEKCGSIAPEHLRFSQHYPNECSYSDINFRWRTGVLGMSRAIDKSVGEKVWSYNGQDWELGTYILNSVCEHATVFVFLTVFFNTITARTEAIPQ